ncbi:MAG: 2Fe-2S iron-sulfur cluster-binding protein [Candidatus Izemoplasmatales bacterium]
MNINFLLNGTLKVVNICPGEMLLDTLKKLDILSVRRGCDTTSCGVCTVLLDNKPIPSCSFLSVRADGHAVTTVEGIPEEAEKLAKCFGEEGADQCGFCNPAFALTAYAMKQEKIVFDEQTIKDYLVGNLCRCSGYLSQEKALRKYLGVDQ